MGKSVEKRLAVQVGARERFRCVKCGVRMEGKVGKAGMVYAYDRSATPVDAVERPIVCAPCADAYLGPEPRS